MSKPDILLFDMDGTTIDTDLLIVGIWQEIFAEFKPGHKPHLKDLLSYSGPPLKVTFSRLFPDIPLAELQAFYSSHVDKYYDTSVIAFEGEREALLALKEAGYRLGIVTNKIHSSTLLALEKTGLSGIFDVLVCGDEVKAQKPSPEGILFALESLGEADPSKAVYIGDTAYDQKAAENAGTSFIHARFSIRESLSGAPYEAHSFEELRRMLAK